MRDLSPIAHLKKQRWADALDALLEAWRETRAPELAALIERVAVLLPHPWRRRTGRRPRSRPGAARIGRKINERTADLALDAIAAAGSACAAPSGWWGWWAVRR